VAAVRFEVRLILRAADVTPAALDSRTRLGYGAFLVTRPQTQDRHETRYHFIF
jgi:predicted component of type VI protein secretion system